MNPRTVSRLILLFAFLLTGAARAAEADIRLPAPEPLPFIPVLNVRGAEEPVRLEALAVRTVIEGGIAEVSLDMKFHNPNARDLEGELQFPLLPGQEISGLALDIHGEMRSGVPVPKARGQEVFEEITRRNVDPALLEAAQGNMYKLRIYPIPARGGRRVMVRFLQPLEQRDGLFTLRVPLNFARNIGTFDVEAVVAAAGTPRVESGSLGLTLSRTGTVYTGRSSQSAVSPEGWLVIGIPAESSPAGSGSAVRWEDKIYFTAWGTAKRESAARKLPDLVTLVWDASGSGSRRSHAREYALLDRYFAAFGDGRVRVIAVRNTAEPAEEFPVRQGNWSAVKAFLHSLDYDGGTDLAAWQPAEDCSEYLLFTDGLANFGRSREESVMPPMLPGQRLYAVTSSAEADHALLRRAGGGMLIDLLHQNADTAARLLLEDSTAVRLQPAELAGTGEVLLDPLTGRGESNADRVQYRLAGWMHAGAAGRPENIALILTHPDGREEPVSCPLPAYENIPVHDSDQAPLPARLWGRYAITEMEAQADLRREAIRRLGEKLGIVSRETSLIVLETAADYVRYDIAPPPSLREEAARLRSAGSGKRAEFLQPQELKRKWDEKVAWWQRDFTKRPKRRTRKQAVPLGSSGTGSADAGTEGRTASEFPDSRNRQSEIPAASFAANQDAMDSFYAFPETEIAAEPAAARPAPLPAFSVSARRMAAPADTAAGTPARPDHPARKGIALQPWRSDAPYIARMKNTPKEDMYAVYLDERPNYERSSAFYLDMADRFFAAGLPDLGLRILSNIAEIDLENRQLLRMLAYRLLEAKEPRLALGILRKVRELAPYEPQSLRDLAAAHRALGNDAAAAELLYETACRAWDDRFGDINVIALTELNALLARTGTDTSAYDPDLIRNLPSDLRVVLSWDTDNTDMDLWITDPFGERCSYENRLTRQGGAMSRDCTQGYGPEEFMLKKAAPGKYRIEAEYYGSSQQVLSGEVTLYVTLTLDFGTVRHREETITLRLKEAKARVFIGEFTVE